MCGVFRGGRSERDYSVVTCSLAFSSQPALGYPYQRVKPIESANESGAELSERIPARHVGELMAEHDSAMSL